VHVESLVDDLDERQREAVLSTAAPLCVLAPPGSGKTRVLTRRIARRVIDGSADEQHVLAITFTRRAAGELRRRLAELGLRNGAWTGTFHATALRLMRQRDADLRRRAPVLLAHRAGLVEAAGGARHSAEIAAEIDWASAQRLGWRDYAAAARQAGRRTPLSGPKVAEVFARYETVKRERGLVDFDDLLRAVIDEVKRDPAYAAALRWRLRHLFVDEFQDVNPLQHAFLEAVRGERADLFVVGDPRQAIYGWNGADATWLTEFGDRYPAATTLHLRASHRSSPQILRLASQVLAGTEPAPVPTRPDGPEPRYHHAPDDDREAAMIAVIAREARGPQRSWSSIAVLTRTNAQLGPIADALAASGIPARRRVGVERAAILDELRSHPGRGGVRRWLDDREDPLPPSLARAIADALAQDPDLDAGALRATLSGEWGDDGDGVTLATFHAAKGLEWPVVIVAGAARRLVPHAAATTSAARAEEQRLLYVALTRAERELHVTWAGAASERSPFLPDPPTEPAAAPPPPRLAASVAVDPVLAALRTWRAGAARAARVEEQIVCSDDDLAALAASAPVTLDDVAAVIGPMAAHHLGPRMLAALRQGGCA
jgi:DNA helicase-2/ATP-dependent DNA helicase PcrA